MALISGLVGFLILLFGRQFYFFFVGGMFILLGLHTGAYFSFIESSQTLIIFSLVLGLIAALATIKLKRGMAAVGGFLAGGALLMWFPQLFGWSTAWFSWPVFIAAGLISAVLVLALQDYALIVLSVLLGALLVAQNLLLTVATPSVVFLVAALIGFMTQVILLQYGSGYPD